MNFYGFFPRRRFPPGAPGPGPEAEAWAAGPGRGSAVAVVRALAAGSGPGPMASSSSIDIEDATQHLRDILKLDRPGGEAPGPRGRGRPGRRAGPCPGPGLRDPPQPGPLSQAAALRGWARLPRGAGGIALRRLWGEGGPARPCPGAGGEGGVRRPGAGEQPGGPSLMAGGDSCR